MSGFSIIELLICISIICVLISLVIPSLNKIRESSRDVKCCNNIKQLYISTSLYVKDYKDLFYYPDHYPDVSQPNLSLYYYTCLSPYLDAEPPTVNKRTSPWTCSSDKFHYTSSGISYLYSPTFIRYSAILNHMPTNVQVLYDHNFYLALWSEKNDFHAKQSKNAINMNGSLFNKSN